MTSEYNNIEIREYGNGTFQVWRSNRVLHPDNFTWEPSYQSEHEWMYFISRKKAESQLRAVLAKETVVATHKVQITIEA